MPHNNRGYFGASDRNTEDDEEIARRLQFEEQSRPSTQSNRSVGGGRGYSQQERSDMELARQYAEMDLNVAGNSSNSSNNNVSAGHKSPSTYGRSMNHSFSSRTRSTSPTPHTSSAHQQPDPFDYGSRSPRRYSANLVGANAALGNATGAGGGGGGAQRDHHFSGASPGHRRRNTLADGPSARFYEAPSAGFDDFKGHRRQSTGSPMRGGDSGGSEHTPRAQAKSLSLRLPLSGTEPTASGGSNDSSGMSTSRSYHRRSSSSGRNRDFLGGQGIGNYHLPAAQRQERVYSVDSQPPDAEGGYGLPARNRERAFSSVDSALHNAASSTSGGTDSQMDYARQLQLAAFSNLQDFSNSGGAQQAASSTSQHSVPTASGARDTDAELARKMQALEDRGMGRVNSDKDIDIGTVEASSYISDTAPTSLTKTASNSSSASQCNDELARLIAESGTSFNDISDEVLRELLGSSAAKQLQLVAAIDPTIPGPTSTGLHPNSPSIQALRAALSGVDRADIERRATSLDLSDGRAKSSATSSRKLTGASSRNVTNNPTTRNTTNVSSSSSISSSSRALVNKNAVAVRSPTSPKSMVESAPERTFEQVRAAEAAQALEAIAVIEDATPLSPSKKKKRRGFLNFAHRSNSRDNLDTGSTRKPPPGVPALEASVGGIPAGIPAAIPPPPGGSLSIKPASGRQSRQNRSVSPTPRGPPAGIPPAGIPGGIPAKPMDVRHHVRNKSFNGSFRGTSVCSACGLSHGTFLKAFDRKFHPECFRCSSCNGKIDPNDQFKYTTDEQGQKHPHHRECFMSFGVTCTVCKSTIPATPDGRVPFIKHPFFESEQMCVRHADERLRRCSGCQRFEPRDTPFIDLMDGERCVCSACCRSVVVDSSDIKPLWRKLMLFFENFLKLPVWGPMREMDILVVGSEMIKKQMQTQNSIHGTASVPTVAGLCLMEENPQGGNNGAYFGGRNGGRSSQSSPPQVIAILCLTGLPRDLAASVLAHEASHAWLKGHPKYDAHKPLPPQVEEGIAQLIAMLFLSDGLDPAPTSTSSADGPSDEKLRQYFKFSIEREKNEIYGTGYRRAAMAYRDIGIEALLTHILQYRDFPLT